MAQPERRHTLLPRGQALLETRRLTPAMSRTVLELLDLLGYDPATVGEVKLSTSAEGILAHVTYVPANPLRVVGGS